MTASLAPSKVSTIARILRYRAKLRRRERWTRAELAAHQQHALAELLAFAVERSPFYARSSRGLEGRPLSEWPPLTKATLMSSFDEIVTDRALTLAAVESHLRDLCDDELFHGKYWITATSGSSGRRSIIPHDRIEWATVVASYARASEWSGIRISPLRRARMAVVSSRSPFHGSARVGRTVETPLMRTCRLDAAQPLVEIVGALDDFQPEVLVAYSSMVRLLAEEQLAGRLHVSPRCVSSSSEVLTREARERATEAWGVPPFDVYAATEAGGIAAECDRHRGMHVFEDLVIPEVVDDAYRPVPAGVTGSRLLVTVLFSRTLPLVRYELTDRVQLAEHDCDCGRPFRLIAAVEGRTDDVMELRSFRGEIVRVHPIVFHHALELLHAGGWQVRQEPDGIRVLVKPEGALDRAAIGASIERAVRAAGAVPARVRVEEVWDIPAGASGKRPLVIALR